MAKKNTNKSERRAMVEQMRSEQARKERLRSLSILGVCVVIVAGLIGSAVFVAVKDSQDKAAAKERDLATVGAAAEAAGCDPVLTKPASGSGQHVDNGAITYTDSPPASGDHRSVTAPFARYFYEEGDRPEVGNLVHNLEHGYVVAWYDSTIANDKDQLEDLKAIGEKYNLNQERFIVAPWTEADGAPFPEGKHVAYTRWSAEAGNTGDASKQRGNWQYCASVSGQVADDFFQTWPNEQSPEPNLF